ncbi:MAG TPA: hypothetical protein VGF75_08100 [Candidatus Saccharimonadales bacterium]|jgi:hypothetical protein
MSTTVVSLIGIQDPSGQIWEGATVTYNVLLNGPAPIMYEGSDIPDEYLFPQSIILDGSGDGTFTVPDSVDITPVNSLWKVTINPNASTQGTTIYIFITGSAMDISTIVNTALATPGVSPLVVPRAYSDDEIISLNVDGQLYFNTGSDEGLRVWQDGAFVAVGSGGGGGFTVTGSPSVPSPAYVPIYQGGSSDTAVWGNLTQDDILPGFSISSFAGGSTVEIGAAIVNPAFTASYSSLPDSADITNTDGIDSPLTLTTPFTSGTVTGTFTKSSAGSTVFTLHATKSGNTKTATQTISSLPRNFGGVGTAGATGATASGTTAVLAGATGTLASAGLFSSPVGVTFGTYTPSGQKVYVLTTGGSHAFKDAITGFAFAFNTPTSVSFTNQNGDVVAMDLYESTNTLTGTFEPECVS